MRIRFAARVGAWLCVGALALTGCDNSSTPNSTADMTQSSSTCCGDPGDTGNADGVGKYCTKQSDCAGAKANICSNINDTPDRVTSFCTTTCDVNVANSCNSGASCTKDSKTGFYGCVPNKCIPPKAGCTL